MCLSHNRGYRQQGSSAIELPVCILIMVVIILFVVKINQGMSAKSQLDRVAYSLTSIVACEKCEIKAPGSGSAPVVSTTLADSLLTVAQRHFSALLADSTATLGIHVEQVTFTGPPQGSYHDAVAGSACLSEQSLESLKALSPKRPIPGLNHDKRAELFQVTLCLVGMTSFAGDFTPLLLNFSDRYYQSSALLIGRKYD